MFCLCSGMNAKWIYMISDHNNTNELYYVTVTVTDGLVWC